MEEVLQKISEYWAVFVASGAYVMFLTYGTVIIRQLFAKATASRIVTKFISTISVGINFIKTQLAVIKTKLAYAIAYITATHAKVQRLENKINEMSNTLNAFIQSIVNATGQEEVLNLYNANLSHENTPTSDEIVFDEEEAEEEVLPVVVPIVKPNNKKPKKAKNKKAVAENEEIY